MRGAARAQVAARSPRLGSVERRIVAWLDARPQVDAIGSLTISQLVCELAVSRRAIERAVDSLVSRGVVNRWRQRRTDVRTVVGPGFRCRYALGDGWR